LFRKTPKRYVVSTYKHPAQGNLYAETDLQTLNSTR
jgi:hypothetical protein